MSRARSGRRRAQRGYTLIEVIVAFALLAFGMALLLGAMTNATRQVRAAGEYGRAALHAQSLLDQTGIGETLEPGRRDGRLENGRYRWEMEIRPWRDPGAPPPAGQIIGAPQMMELDLILHWGEGGPRQSLRVQTLRLITPNDPNAAGVVP